MCDEIIVEMVNGRGGFESDMDLGPCCVCERVGSAVRNIILLDYTAPVPGTGWACFQCGLPADGATAVVCDRCLDGEIRFVVLGLAVDKLRMPVDGFEKRPFEHLMERHPEAGWLSDNWGIAEGVS